MRPRFEVRPVSFDDVHALPEAWSVEDYRDVLEALEFDDARTVDDAEARDLCLMALTDIEPDEAAKVLLMHRLGSELKPGQIEDVSHGLIDEPLWEDYGIMSVHEELYNINQLLYDAYQGRFPRPRAVRLELDVTAASDEGASMLKTPSEAFVARLLAGGLGEDSLLHRLFEDQVAGTRFPEASAIVWRCDHEALSPREAKLVIHGSDYWFHDFEDVGPYEAAAQPDVEPKTDD